MVKYSKTNIDPILLKQNISSILSLNAYIMFLEEQKMDTTVLNNILNEVRELSNREYKLLKENKKLKSQIRKLHK